MKESENCESAVPQLEGREISDPLPERQEPVELEFSFMLMSPARSSVFISPRRLAPPPRPLFLLPPGSWGGGGAIIILATLDEEMDKAMEDAPPPPFADAISTSSRMSVKLGRELVVSNMDASSMFACCPVLVVVGGCSNGDDPFSESGCGFLA